MIRSEQNQKMTDFDYKKYSLEHLENWLHDAMSAGEATPQEIYEVITKVVKEQYYYYKDGASKTYELLALLNGNGVGHIKAYDDCVDKVLSCDKDDPSPECKGAWNSFWEGNVEEQPKTYSEMVADGYEMTADGFWIPPQKQDKVVKWQLPVEMDPSGEYFVMFPNDLLDAANLNEGDSVEWVDNGDGSYILKKVENPT